MNHPPPRWLHALAVLTVLATLPLLFLGAEVTTKGVGMVDPVGYHSPWSLVQLLADATGLGLQIEYSHRAAGFVVGTCAIALVAALWLFERRRWVCWVGVLALALVCTQGLLGIFRVNFNARTIALVHGCFAQLVIATLVSVALFTSRSWVNDPAGTSAGAALRRGSLLTAALVYGQLVLGGYLRHVNFPLGARLHLVGAFVVVAAVAWLVTLTRRSERRAALSSSVKVLVGLVAVQLLVGVEALMFRVQVFYLPGVPPAAHADWVRSAHYVVGTLLFSASVVVALKANRRPVVLATPAPARTLEGAL